jgi:putative transposase
MLLVAREAVKRGGVQGRLRERALWCCGTLIFFGGDMGHLPSFVGGQILYISAMRSAPQETRTFLVTAATAQRRRLFQVTVNAELLRQVLFDYRGQGKFLLHAHVVMPDHFHALITPASEVSLEKAVQYIKGGFSFRLKSKMDVWMRSFNESQISTADKFTACVRYIEENPVRARLVSSADVYPFSSAGQEGLDPMPAHFRV